MTWDILADTITLIGVAVTLGTVLARLVKVLTKLDVSVTALTSRLDSFESDADKEHKRLEDKIDTNAKVIDDHEMRIHDLERDKGRRDDK